jgi:uncharacterized protein YndB with AHSA1/START domain
MPENVMKQKVGDEAVKKATGKDWAGWLKILDKAGGRKMNHKQLVAFLDANHKVSGWWIQMVTVGYEQARGLRVLHEKPGGFEIGVSKTVNVPIQTLFEAFADEKQRAAWCGDWLSVRKATRPKSARFNFKDGTLVSVNFFAKAKGKSYVGVGHLNLKSATAAERMKKFWTGKLAELKAQLEA